MTYRVHALVAPPVWRTFVAVALDSLAAATIFYLVLVATACPADILGLTATSIMWHEAGAVPVLDFDEIVVAPDAMERWRRGECCKK